MEERRKKNQQEPPQESRETREMREMRETRETREPRESQKPLEPLEMEAPVEANNESTTNVESELEDLRNSHLRLAADFENYKRHTKRELLEAKDKGRDELVKKLAEIIGELEKATKMSSSAQDGTVAGVQMTLQKIHNSLQEFGYERIPTIGEAMNPEVHEAVAVVPTPQPPPGIVIEELTPGFQRQNKLVLPARVVVSQARG